MFMDFWNYCPNCGKRLVPNEEICSVCGIKTISSKDDESYIFSPPIHNIGFFNLKIDFSPYININNDFQYDICVCGYLNEINNEFCYHCGVRRSNSGILKRIKKIERPKFNMDNIEVNTDIICECGALNSKDSEFCDMCGRRLHEEEIDDEKYSNFYIENDNPIFCICGKENSEDSQFCQNCGLPLDSYEYIDDIKILCVCSVLNDVTSDFCVECGNPLAEEATDIICICGTRNSIDELRCSSCQKPLNKERIVKSKIVCGCGKIIDFNSEFCPNCGNNVKIIIRRRRNFSKTFDAVKNVWKGV